MNGLLQRARTDQFTRTLIKMAADLIHKDAVLHAIRELFKEERLALKSQSQFEQNIIGNKLAVIEIELKKQIKYLPVTVNEMTVQHGEKEEKDQESAERS